MVHKPGSNNSDYFKREGAVFVFFVFLRSFCFAIGVALTRRALLDTRKKQKGRGKVLAAMMDEILLC